MSVLSSGGTDVDAIKAAVSNLPTGNALPILSEILDALGALLETGKTTVIDLGAIPFTGGDEKIMQEILGDGEVSAVLSLMGESHVQETSIAGVWRVDHYDSQGKTQSRFIEVTFLPDILRTQSEDAMRGHETLSARLSAHMGAT